MEELSEKEVHMIEISYEQYMELIREGWLHG